MMKTEQWENGHAIIIYHRVYILGMNLEQYKRKKQMVLSSASISN